LQVRVLPDAPLHLFNVYRQKVHVALSDAPEQRYFTGPILSHYFPSCLCMHLPFAARRARENLRADWKKDLQIYEAGRRSQMRPRLVAGGKPKGKSYLINNEDGRK
jgi:hypothetical protein